MGPPPYGILDYSPESLPRPLAGNEEGGTGVGV